MSGAVRFHVTKATEGDSLPTGASTSGDPVSAGGGYGAVSAPTPSRTSETALHGGGSPAASSHEVVHLPSIELTDPNGVNKSDGEDSRGHEKDRLTDDVDKEKGMSLYEEDLERRPKISRILHSLANYQSGFSPAASDGEKGKSTAKLGTLLGVYLPTIQNIFGVILFIRLSWIVGMAGGVESFFIVFVCCCTTMLTAISMSAIATNGVVPGGGSYFMISRSLGPEFGGAVGILFYLGTTVASAMYIVGAVEILLLYIARPAVLIGDIAVEADKFNNFRIYGTIVLIVLFFCVFLGVKFVSIVAAISLSCVILSILSIYIGIFVSAAPSPKPTACFLGNRLLLFDAFEPDQAGLCGNASALLAGNNSTPLTDVLNTVCPEDENGTHVCTESFRADLAIPGLTSDMFIKNMLNRYKEAGQRVSGNESGLEREEGNTKVEVVADITTSFTILLAIFFPSCTGIMAGSNRSGDLQDAQKSIPTGTIAAILTTSLVYLSSVLFFAATVNGDVLRDKFGESIGGRLIVAELSWPHPYVILIGSFLSSLGAGLQSLTGAPRLLNAIAKDGVIPFLNVFSKTTKKGEPLIALFLTAAISEVGILIANLDTLTPIITMFFLMCYGFVNAACALQTLLKTPSWRPRFRFYHWTLSLLGLALCIALMFISSWYYALAAMVIALAIYKYIEYKGAEKEWGDGLRGLSLSAARYALLRLEQGPPHTKNWRPQILLFMKLDGDLQPKHPKMFNIVNQMKAGKGLTIVSAIVEGNIKELNASTAAAKQTLMNCMKQEKVKGFAEVLAARDEVEGVSHMIQSAGLGGLKHNTVMVTWPYGWRHDTTGQSWRLFVETIRLTEAANCALLAVRGDNVFPSNNEKMVGTIDIWWIVHDGGMLMLLPFLLKQNKVWKSCTIRIFTVAQIEDNSIQMKKDLEVFLYHLRISAQVSVIELADSDVSAYTYGRTIMMEQRTKMIREMNLSKREQELVSMTELHQGPAGQVSAASVSDDPTQGYVSATDVVVQPSAPKVSSKKVPEVQEEDEADGAALNPNLYTFSPAELKENFDKMKGLLQMKPESKNVRRMHTAVKLNEVIVERSHDAKLVMLNLPGPPKNERGYENYMEYLEVLTEGIDRVLLVRGSGREVITIYS